LTASFRWFISRVPYPLTCSDDVIAQNAISPKRCGTNGRKQMPPTTRSRLMASSERCLRSNTSRAMYSRGILGSCVAKMFLTCVSQIMCCRTPSLRTTRNCSAPASSSLRASSSRAVYGPVADADAAADDDDAPALLLEALLLLLLLLPAPAPAPAPPAAGTRDVALPAAAADDDAVNSVDAGSSTSARKRASTSLAALAAASGAPGATSCASVTVGSSAARCVRTSAGAPAPPAPTSAVSRCSASAAPGFCASTSARNAPRTSMAAGGAGPRRRRSMAQAGARVAGRWGSWARG
jgi:hypothetical protein